ncbi:RIP metalloprotease RseP [Sphingobium boeckii]|uniref:Zinc metalloprotease n=1 Tax=Sphingobium boeckii TaxID=1082345 RepID=A0A7W9AKE7_9SPHN|nr:regulator of sigma E protease [Sphingobium boeckii]
MTENPGIILTILAFALVIGPLVFIHEMGHYLVGRFFGVHAEVFSIGFGKEIKGWTDRRGTRWKLAWMPLGGYVRFAGDMSPASQPTQEWLTLPPEQRARTFQAKPVWQRALIVLAGPAVNFLVAIIILAGLLMVNGEDRTPAVIKAVQPGSAAAQAGFLPGDTLQQIAGRDIDSFGDVVRIVKPRPGELLDFQILRGGRVQNIVAAPGVEVEKDRFGNTYKMGLLGLMPVEPVRVSINLLEAPAAAVRQTGQIMQMMVDGLGQIITGRRSVKELGGPLKIAQVSGEMANIGPETFIFFIALISINLGFINLLPVPMLDGGHLLFYAIEAVRRKPVSIMAQEWAFRSGLLVLLTLMVFVTFNDLSSFGVWDRLSGLIG